MISTAVEYTLAMSIELSRRSRGTDADAKKRSLELSAFFTIPKLEVAHRQWALGSAMTFAFKNQNQASAANFANRIIANGGSAKLAEQVSVSLRRSESELFPVANLEYLGAENQIGV